MSAMANWWQSIRERTPQIKGDMHSGGKDMLVVLAIFLVGISAFGLGRLSNLEEQRPAVTLTNQAKIDEAPMRLGGKIVASRRGSKYHYPWCSGAQAMKESNKIWFDSIEDARGAGYTPAKNCKGLK